MWIILKPLEMDTVMEEITIPKSVDMMEVTGAHPRDRFKLTSYCFGKIQ
jgi:hypothetical protein